MSKQKPAGWKKLLAWALYDVGSTAYSALVISFFFPILIRNHLGGNEIHLGLVSTFSMFTAAIAVPVLGAFSDRTGQRMPYLLALTVLTVILAAIVGILPLKAALIIAALANLTYLLAIDLYDTKLAEIAPPKAWGRISGLGISLGYLGVLMGLGLAASVLIALGQETKIATQLMFPIASVFFLMFSLPMFFLVRDQKFSSGPIFVHLIAALKSVRSTWQNLATRDRPLRNFLLSSFFYNDALNTVMLFLYLYASREVGLSLIQFFWVFATMASMAAIGAGIGGFFCDRFGHKNILLAALLVWSGVVGSMALFPRFWVLFGVGLAGGLFWGVIWTASRPLLASLAPREKLAELFGFLGLSKKVAGIIGPLSFGVLAFNFGYQKALLVVLVLFLFSFFLLLRVRLKRVSPS